MPGDADIARYREDGVLFPLPAIGDSEVDATLGALARLESLPEPARKSALTTKSHLLSRTLWDLVHHPAIVEAASTVIGPDLLVWGAGFFKKPAGSPDYRQLAPGRHLLGPGAARYRHRLGGAQPEHDRKRLPARGAGQPPLADPAAPRDLRRPQPPEPRPGDRRGRQPTSR